jgi:hypothetical protein
MPIVESDVHFREVNDFLTEAKRRQLVKRYCNELEKSAEGASL